MRKEVSMLYIQHRVNTIPELELIAHDYGVEIDIRAYQDNLILHHDAFIESTNFESFLQKYAHSFLILNVKAEGLEERILYLLEKYKISRYFFLDMSLPFLIRYAKKGIKQIAVRYSEYEPVEAVMKFKHLVEWVWVDGFNDFSLTFQDYTILKPYFKLCLVSPELQGKSIHDIPIYYQKMENMVFDAICTKYPEEWKKYVE